MRKALFLAAMILLVAAVAGAGPEAKAKKGWLGVLLASTKECKEAGGRGEPNAADVKILSVLPDSPAESAGLKEGDIVLQMDGEHLDHEGAFVNLVGSKKPGDEVRIVVMRDGQKKTFDVVLGERPEHGSLPSLPGEGYEKALQVLKLQGLPDLPGLEALQEGKRGYIGVQVQDLTPELRTYFGAAEGRGILVASVEKDSPARAAGLEAGDVILQVNGKDIGSNRELQKAIRELKKGDQANIRLLRRGAEMSLTVTVDERSAKKISVFCAPGDDEKRFVVEVPDSDLDVDIPEIDLKELQEGIRSKCKVIGKDLGPGHEESLKKMKIVFEKNKDLEADMEARAEELKELLNSEEFKEKLESFKSQEELQAKRVQELELKIKKLEEKLKALEAKER